MKTRRSVSAVIVLVSALLLSVAGGAEAASLNTASLFIAGVTNPGDTVACEVANVTAADINNLTIDVHDQTGVVVNSTGPFTLPAGVSVQLDFIAGTDERFRCVFDAANINGLRPAINRFNPSSGSVADLNGFGQIK